MKRGFIEKHGMPKSYWRKLLSEWVSETNADIFDRAYLEEVSYEQVAVEFDKTPRQIINIAQKTEKIVLAVHYCN